MDTNYIFPIVSIIFLIILSAFFSCAETGMTAVTKAKIHKLTSEGNKRAKMITDLRKDKEGLIGTLLLGNNAVNIFASALATSLAIQWLDHDGVAYATIIMTLVVLIFAEVLPKTYAFQNAEKVSLFVAPVLVFIIRLFYPITYIINKIVRFFIKLMNLEEGSEMMSSSDVVRGAIALYYQEGAVSKRDFDMLDSIIDLPETEVSEVMVHRKSVFSIDIKEKPSEIINKVLDHNFTRVPVWKGKPENIIGMLHVKDLLSELREHEGDIDTLDLKKVIKEPWFVPETNSLSNQLVQFRIKKNHLALVVDEYGDLTGLITLEDILEEIVGQIDDEHDESIVGIRKIKDGSVNINGEITIRDINRRFNWNLPDEDATTIAGLIIHKAEKIPSIHEEFTFDGFHFKIMGKKGHQITRIKVVKLG